MTDEQINRAIAEACGPKLFVLHKPIHDPFGYYRPNACGYTANIDEAWRLTGEDASKYTMGTEDQPDRVVAEPAPIPNYCRDLNAMHEAEGTLEDRDPADEYANALGEIAFGKDFDPFDHYCWPPVVKASARQRAEAFLKTIGKWTE